MKKFTHKFRNFDPYAASLSSKLGLRNEQLHFVPLPDELELFPSMAFDAARIIASQGQGADIDGMSIQEWKASLITIFDEGIHFRNELEAENRIEWGEEILSKKAGTRFQDNDFVWSVDVFSQIVVDSLPDNRKHYSIAEACLAPLALALLICIDLTLSAIELREEKFQRHFHRLTEKFAWRLKVIPLFGPQSPEDLSRMGANARHATSHFLADYARELYQAEGGKAKFKNLTVAATALTPLLHLKAKNMDKTYSGNFERTVYNWLRNKK